MGVDIHKVVLNGLESYFALTMCKSNVMRMTTHGTNGLRTFVERLIAGRTQDGEALIAEDISTGIALRFEADDTIVGDTPFA